MCVQDYITWVAIKRNFEAISHIEQAHANAQRSTNLGLIERDELAVTIAEGHKAQIATISSEMDKKIALVTQQLQVMSDELYTSALFDQAKHLPKPSRQDIIAKVQGIELRVKIAKAVAIERVASLTCMHIDALHSENDRASMHY